VLDILQTNDLYLLSLVVLFRSRSSSSWHWLIGENSCVCCVNIWDLPNTVMTTTVSARGSGLSSLNKTSVVII